jgi:transcriptional regulator with GAF, ATPase, and Fis domain
VPVFSRRAVNPSTGPPLGREPSDFADSGIAAAIQSLSSDQANLPAMVERLMELRRQIDAMAAEIEPAKTTPQRSDPDARTATAFQIITTFDELSAQLLAAQDLKSAVEAILEAAIRLHRPDFVTVQLLDERTNQLVICAQRGHGQRFLKTFERISADDGCASGRVLRDRAPVIVEDVLSDAEYSAFRPIAVEAGYRAVLSIPLIASSGKLVGATSISFARPHTPSPLDMLMMQFHGRLAADTIARLAQA